MAELDQLKAGLNELGIYDMMKSNPSVFLLISQGKNKSCLQVSVFEVNVASVLIIDYTYTVTSINVRGMGEWGGETSYIHG